MISNGENNITFTYVLSDIIECDSYQVSDSNETHGTTYNIRKEKYRKVNKCLLKLFDPRSKYEVYFRGFDDTEVNVYHANSSTYYKIKQFGAPFIQDVDTSVLLQTKTSNKAQHDVFFIPLKNQSRHSFIEEDLYVIETPQLTKNVKLEDECLRALTNQPMIPHITPFPDIPKA